jgi:hypothetical protein
MTMALGTRSTALGSKPKAPKPKTVKEPKPKKPKAPRPPRTPRASGVRRTRRAGGAGRGGKSVLHTCGHRECHRLKPGPKWKKEREVEHWAKLPCTPCWRAKQCEDDEILHDAEGLPPLTGTVAQVDWARSIRARAVGKARHAAALSLDQIDQLWEIEVQVKEAVANAPECPF